MKNVHISKHPVVLDKIARLRDRKTNVADFRRLMGELAMFLAHDALLNARVKKAKVRTPVGVADAMRLSHDLVFVAILRAGLGMVDGLLKLYPEAKLAHIGIYRDEETLKPVKYYVRLPENVADSLVVIADPMLATGGSAVEAVEIMKSRGAKNICFVCMIASREGIKRLSSAHPEMPIYVGTVDERLNGDGYIVPGLGDAGDRMFGTA
ncbi:MAG TPA: uracil phosphoribosyltransferase [Elusimicrobia bacterium]|nr:MAG: uracil phosphoribosyltransferase [Elusimicrobia bacterium GWA2_64_40]OGR65600.1 MAG: uracil phosphoribosyltransferase [Elusimicrobia bacterium GWB2_63_16]HAN04623.1 uracil phosphoribosyltransferase [Elusimicrobiota bacterium]HAU90295.1 uracil phosphoribosyltransferase [Elusimicrobiota bacterium]